MSSLAQLRQALILEDEAQRRRAQKSFLPYVVRTTPGYLVGPPARKICDALDAVVRGELPRLVVVCPPRLGKSTLISRRFPAYYLGRYPTRDVMLATSNGRLSGGFGRQLRNLMGDASHLEIFPEVTLDSSSQARDLFHTSRGGQFLAASLGSAIQGQGFHMAILDDLVKGREAAASQYQRDTTWEWYQTEFFTRRAPDTHTSIVAVGTRWHDDDIMGRLLNQNRREDPLSGETVVVDLPGEEDVSHEGDTEDLEQWDVIHIPALDSRGVSPHPERIGSRWFRRVRASVTKTVWNCLYQGDPTPDDGTYFKAHEMIPWRTLPDADDLTFYLTSDLAATEDGGDFSVVCVWAISRSGLIYLVDFTREQQSARAALDQLFRWNRLYRPSRWGTEGDLIVKALDGFITTRERTDGRLRREEFGTSGSKEVKALAFQSLMQEGRIRLPAHHAKYPALKAEFLAFPRGRHDDIVDACGVLGRMVNRLYPPQLPHAVHSLPVMVHDPSTVLPKSMTPMQPRDILRLDERGLPRPN